MTTIELVTIIGDNAIVMIDGEEPLTLKKGQAVHIHTTTRVAHHTTPQRTQYHSIPILSS